MSNMGYHSQTGQTSLLYINLALGKKSCYTTSVGYGENEYTLSFSNRDLHTLLYKLNVK